MKKILLLLLIATCSSCAKDHGKVIADLTFLSIERKDDLPLYTIHYNSNVKLLNLYGEGARDGIAAAFFICALGDDQDLSVGHTPMYYAAGLIKEDAIQTSTSAFNFTTRLPLYETPNNGQSNTFLSQSKLNELLTNKQSIPCKAVITAYGYKAYYSNTLQLPVAELLRGINKPETP
ncbi:hypothetical protein [Pseudomonas chlororaphis]|uniref:hypothetical protein n=1 Tax=Pseudomonas chlororaphis TaxID=587753 RepID=UPI0024078796|nr:hypothetical protein [Pseudomonas chlororaphis]